MVRHIGEIMGYMIQPYKPDANWWMFRGPGGDGKSTLIKILNGILGDSLYSADQSLLSSGGSGGNSHIISDLVSKLVVVIEELQAGKALNDSGLKMLSENTKMTANPKIKDSFSFNYIGSLIMCCNSFPRIKDTTEGTIRRVNVIPFNRQFVKTGLDDKNRSDKILKNKEEISGVLNFMLEGYQRYINRGRFKPPVSCELAKQEWLSQANNVIRFVKENIKITEPYNVIGVGSFIYNRYERWCTESGIKSKGRNNFYVDLENLGFKKKPDRTNVVTFYGGELLEEVCEDF
jgi:putative DNA primase/helicase